MAKFERTLSQLGVAIPTAENLRMALTHRSAGKGNYERMEFLGDSLVNMVCAELLFRTETSASEGELTRLRSNLVDEASLAAFARSLKLGDFLILGGGESKSGGHRRDSILADTFEALCAAIYLDHGLTAMRALLDDTQVDPSFKAAVLSLPGAAYVAEHLEPFDPQRIHAARESMRPSRFLSAGRS